MRFCAALFALILLASCGQSPAPENAAPAAAAAAESKIETLTGLFFMEKSGGTFRDCNTGKTYFLQDDTRSLDTLYPQFLQQPSYANEPAFAIVQGKIGPAAAANFDGTLAVSRVDSVDYLNFMNCCESYDFWCSGTEPFWNLQIFPPEGGGSIVFRDASAEQAMVFPAVRPTLSGNTWTYATRAADGTTLRAVVRREKASDGMSDIEFHYSCALSIGAAKYSGVAIGYAERASIRD